MKGCHAGKSIEAAQSRDGGTPEPDPMRPMELAFRRLMNGAITPDEYRAIRDAEREAAHRDRMKRVAELREQIANRTWPPSRVLTIAMTNMLRQELGGDFGIPEGD